MTTLIIDSPVYLSLTLSDGSQGPAGPAGPAGASPSGIHLQTFSGTGTQTVFTLTYAPYSKNNTQIYISGVYQEKDTYTVSGTTLIFSEAPVEGTDNIEVTSLSVMDLGATTSDMVSYLPAGTGAVTTTVQAKLRENVSVKDFGAVGDGVTDDTNALVLAAASLQSGQSLNFGSGTYLISYQGTPNSSVYGNVVLDILNKSDIGFIGTGATIKVSNHNISTYGGLRFANFKGCKRVRIEGLNFDMSFTGVNTSASRYPFCGAITAVDDDSASPDFSTLNSDFSIERCTFKLFHPYGNWALSGTTYNGDQNNGYKLFSIFAFGPNTPNNDQHLCRNITVKDCTWLDGHNGYGIWTWAWNSVRIEGNRVDNWVTKHSDQSGVYQGGGVAFIRNIPFWSHGMVVTGNQFRARPSADRSGSFAGIAQFYVQANNMGAVGSGKGETIIDGNNIILGTGYSATFDDGVFFNDFGNLIVTGNNFDGHDGQSVVAGSLGINFAPGDSGGMGECTLLVSGNTFGGWLLGSNIYFVNGSNSSAADRRCRSLVVTNNISRNGDFFLRMASYSYKTYEGCPYTVITDNVIDGTRTAAFPPPSVNNYGIAYSGNVIGDTGIIANNVFINKTQPIKTEAAYCSASASLKRYGNSFYGITTPYDAGNVFPVERFEIPQIKFPATPTLSTDPNTLDDYEEGTFTPTIAGTTTAGTGTYTTQVGRYTKIGCKVYFNVSITWTNLTGAAGLLAINGLPFTASNISGNNKPHATVAESVAITAGNFLTTFIFPNSSRIDIRQCPPGGGSLAGVGMLTSGTIYVSGDYDVG